MTNKISRLDVSILSSYLIKSFILINGINILININKNDSIISTIIGFIIGFIYIHLYMKSNEDIISHLNSFSNKKISLLLKLLLVISVIIFSSQILYFSSMFIKSTLLNNVDLLPISILLCVTVTYLVNKDIFTIVKTSFISFFIFLLLELTTLLLVIPNINSLKILPLFTNNIITTAYGGIIYSILSIFPIFLIKSIPKNYIEEKNKKKSIKLLYILSNIYLIFNLILVLSIIDSNLASKINYPEMFILSKISVLNFFDRMESILSFKLLFDSFFTITMGVYYISRFVESIKKRKIKRINLIISIILLLISNYFEYNNNMILISLLTFGILNITIILVKKTNI